MKFNRVFGVGGGALSIWECELYKRKGKLDSIRLAHDEIGNVWIDTASSGAVITQIHFNVKGEMETREKAIEFAKGFFNSISNGCNIF